MRLSFDSWTDGSVVLKVNSWVVVGSETTLTFRDDLLCQSKVVIEKKPGEDLPSNGQEGDSTVFSPKKGLLSCRW